MLVRKPADLGEVCRHHRQTGSEVLLQLYRHDVGGEVGQSVGEDSHIKAAGVGDDLVVVNGTEKPDIGVCGKTAYVGGDRTDEDEAQFGSQCGHLGQHRHIDLVP